LNGSAAGGQARAELFVARTQARAELVVWSDAYAVPGATGLLANAASIGLPPDIAARPALDCATVGPGLVACDVIPAPSTPFLEKARGPVPAAGMASGCLAIKAATGSRWGPGRGPPVRLWAKPRCGPAAAGDRGSREALRRAPV